MPRATDNKRVRFYAVKEEIKLIENLRQYAPVPLVLNGITKAIVNQLDNLYRQMEYMKQEGQELSEEYREVAMSYAPLEQIYLAWRELSKVYGEGK